MIGSRPEDWPFGFTVSILPPRTGDKFLLRKQETLEEVIEQRDMPTDEMCPALFHGTVFEKGQ